MKIDITDAAKIQIHDMMIEETEEARLRFGIKGGGCSGLSYSLGFEYDINKDLDEEATVNGIPVVMAKMDMPIVEDTVIDFKQNMMGGGFTIENPNAIVSCGCGSSFRTNQKEGAPGDC